MKPKTLVRRTIALLLLSHLSACSSESSIQSPGSMFSDRPTVDENGRMIPSDKPVNRKLYNIVRIDEANAQNAQQQKAQLDPKAVDTVNRGQIPAPTISSKKPAKTVDKKPATKKMTITIVPQKPLAGDPLSIKRSDNKAWPTETKFEWKVNFHGISNDATLDTTQLTRGDKIKVIVSSPEGRYEATNEIANQKPVVQGFSKANSTTTGVKVIVKGYDPDGDKVFLELPGKSEGVTVFGMMIILTGDATTTKRSIPLTLSDGIDQKGFLYTYTPR